MGHAPPRRTPRNVPPPTRFVPVDTRETFHLGVARRRFVAGRLDIDEYEASVEHVLRGGTLTQAGRLRVAPSIDRAVIAQRMEDYAGQLARTGGIDARDAATAMRALSDHQRRS